MVTADPEREFAVQVVRQLQEAGHTALWAGGCVRDLLRGKAPHDFDVATDAPPDRVRGTFGDRRTLAVGESFGVVIVLGPRVGGETVKVEVATFRAEGAYPDGRRPDPRHIRFTTPEEDALRRDFTINGMFYDPVREQVLDYVGGEADLKAGVIRAIGEPHARMREDKLRMLRAVRFTATLDFELDEGTAQAIRDMAPELTVVSAERIAQELRKMLVSRHRRRAVRLLQQTDLLLVIFPELSAQVAPAEPVEWLRTLDMLEHLGEATFEDAMAALLHTVPCPERTRRRDEGTSGTVRAICRRLRLSNEELEQIEWLVSRRHALDDPSCLSVAQLKRLLAHPWSTALRNLLRARLLSEGGSLAPVEFLEEFLARTPVEQLNPPPLISGADLIALGLTPGPRFEVILNSVRDAQLSGDLSSRDDAQEMARRLALGGTP
jgi:poly(A) polymerase